MMRQQLPWLSTLCVMLVLGTSSAFLPPQSNLQTFCSSRSSPVLFQSTQQGDEGTDIWLPQLRRIMGGVATGGALETGYLTFNKVFQNASPVPLCGVDGGCNDILNGPYSTIPFTDIPLSALGFVAYCSVAGLAMLPLFSAETDDEETGNRVALLALTTTMGTFSIFLMTLLFGVLQTTCPYCIFSAACSILLAMLAWIGGCLPEGNKTGVQWASSGFLASTATAILLFVSGGAPEAVASTTSGDTSSGANWAGTLVASTASASSETQQPKPPFSPPPITTQSSSQAIALAATLQGMNAKMYGAYWCSHCYDQKLLFGKEAFSKIEYVECSKDGLNSMTKLCRAMEVPGYPTWEIDGKLYPGQQELDELQDLVEEIKTGTK